MKRTVLTILLFILLVSGGAIVNVAVAWGCAAWVPLPPADYTDEDFDALFFQAPQDETDELDDRWLARTGWKRARGDDAWVYVIVRVSSSSLGVTRREFIEWPCLKSREPDSWPELLHLQPADPFARQVRSGWPMRSLLGGHLPERLFWRLNEAWHDPPADSRPSGGFRKRLATVDAIDIGMRKARLGEHTGRDLPLVVIWPGFIINTLFYALILWLLVCGPFALRRLIRLKRGRCPKCGYDLRGQPPEVGATGCPECGWNRQPNATAVR